MARISENDNKIRVFDADLPGWRVQRSAPDGPDGGFGAKPRSEGGLPDVPSPRAARLATVAASAYLPMSATAWPKPFMLTVNFASAPLAARIVTSVVWAALRLLTIVSSSGSSASQWSGMQIE